MSWRGCWERELFDSSLQVLLNRSRERLIVVEIIGVEVSAARTVRLRFSDESERVVDLSQFLWGPAFEKIATNDDLFNEVRVDQEIGTIVWPNGADLDPDVLHGDFEPAHPSHSKA
jgi:hypothetical protein